MSLIGSVLSNLLLVLGESLGIAPISNFGRTAPTRWAPALLHVNRNLLEFAGGSAPPAFANEFAPGARQLCELRGRPFSRISKHCPRRLLDPYPVCKPRGSLVLTSGRTKGVSD